MYLSWPLTQLSVSSYHYLIYMILCTIPPTNIKTLIFKENWTFALPQKVLWADSMRRLSIEPNLMGDIYVNPQASVECYITIYLRLNLINYFTYNNEHNLEDLCILIQKSTNMHL